MHMFFFKKALPIISVGFSILFYFSSVGCVSSETAEKECATLLTTKCNECHYRTRICQALGTKSKRKWRRSIKNMIAYGAKVSENEQKILVNCLYKAPKGNEFICQQPKINEEKK